MIRVAAVAWIPNYWVFHAITNVAHRCPSSICSACNEFYTKWSTKCVGKTSKNSENNKIQPIFFQYVNQLYIVETIENISKIIELKRPQTDGQTLNWVCLYRFFAVVKTKMTLKIQPVEECIWSSIAICWNLWHPPCEMSEVIPMMAFQFIHVNCNRKIAKQMRNLK